MENTLFRSKINKLTEHHRKDCKTYDDICNGLGEVPFLPVAIFKDLDLYSVPEEKLRSKLTSSGTTGQRVSKIYLDGETAAAQQRALCEIVGEYIGEKRIPMLIIDSPDVLRDRRKYSARGAGIMGFSMMASKRYYALDNEMNLDWDSISEFQAKAAEGPTFAFGFTFMIWAYFHNALKKENKTLDLKNCFLIHGGGWKKLQSQSVSNEAFKAGLREVCGIEHVSNYYGMAEQTGSIFMECPAGHLHPSDYSNITALNPEDFSPCKTGEWGLLALESTLPESYPGHRLLTEDWGRILGEDDCPCGRKGKYFEIQGRIKKAEIRGCSDTFAKSAEMANAATSAEMAADAKAAHSEELIRKDITVLAGNFPADNDGMKSFCSDTREAFSDEVLNFIEELSELLIKEYRNIPEIAALGFWCRKAHIQKIKERQLQKFEERQLAKVCREKGKGRGMVLHIAPSNMPTMFAYSWITSLLAGNSNIVRISGRDSEISMIILEAIDKVMQKHEAIKNANAFIQFQRSDSILEMLSARASGRIIWGGDETVKKITAIPAGGAKPANDAEGKTCIDICFPDKYSIAVLDAAEIAQLSDDELKHQARMFYNDTYGADQNACSSPKSVFWISGDNGAKATEGSDLMKKAKARWWDAIARETARYDFQPWMATEKFRMLCCTYAENFNLKPVKAWGNRLYVIPCSTIETPLWKLEAAMGMFYEYDVKEPGEISRYLDGKIQTVVTNIDSLISNITGKNTGAECNCGIGHHKVSDNEPGEIKQLLDVDRIVSIGEALDFDTIWDRKDIIDMLTE